MVTVKGNTYEEKGPWRRIVLQATDDAPLIFNYLDYDKEVKKEEACNLKVVSAWYGKPDGGVKNIDVTAIGGTTPYSFAWSNFIYTEDLTSITAGTYQLQVEDSNGCQDSLSVTLINLSNTF
jgi:hypothetical protein